MEGNAYGEGVYRRVLEAGVLGMGGTVKTLLVHAAHIKKVPGRKTEAQDGSWIAQLLECGLLQGSFVPPRDIRKIRDLTRYRKTLVQQRTEEVLRLHGGPATSRHQITSVASNSMGVSGRAMIEGSKNPDAIAELARGSLRGKTSS